MNPRRRHAAAIVLCAAAALLRCGDTGPAPLPRALVLSPAGGEIFFSGDTVIAAARFDNAQPAPHDVRIELSTDSGVSWLPLDSCVCIDSGDTMRWAWVVPELLTAAETGEQCRLRIAAGSGPSDTSPAFAIRMLPASSGDSGNPRILVPNGGEVYERSDSLQARIRARPDIFVIQAVFELSVDNGKIWYELPRDHEIYLTTCDTTITVDVPDSVYWSEYDAGLGMIVEKSASSASDSCKLKVREYVPGVYYDVTDGVFEIR
jgi:hypothetical protein